jgi:hypothetical protein
MLYVEDTDGSQWLRVVELMCEQAAHDMVLCLYPDSVPDAFAEPFASSRSQEDLERVTTYEDGTASPCSERLRVTADTVEALRPHLGDFEDWGDSLILYPLRERTWTAAFIPHERVVLIRDVRLRDYLDAAGVTVGFEAPDGW